MSTARQAFMTPEQYLDVERAADVKSEFFAGEMFAMAGASRKHYLVALNVAAELRNLLKGRDCEVYSSDMRVKVDLTGLYTYPDVIVVCGNREFEDEELDTLLNPTLVVEVLSDSTEAYDRGEKFAHYRKLDSLREYLLIAQDRCRVEHYVRQSDNCWLLSEIDNPAGRIDLPSIDCQLQLADVYLKVEFQDDDRGEHG